MRGIVRPATTAPFDQRRGAVNRIEAMTGKVHRVQGFFTLTGAGERSVEVDFPVWFVENPVLTFGGELAPNEFPEAGYYPTVSVVVLAWKLKTPTPEVNYYVGAHLGAVTTGKAAQVLIVHWQVEARALRNPLGDAGGTDGVI
jgi:hypothetical protein